MKPPGSSTQAFRGDTFRVPPFHEDTLVLPQLYQWHRNNSPDHPFFMFHDGTDTRAISMLELLKGMHRAAHLISATLKAVAGGTERPLVIGVLAAADTITYFTFMLGVLLTGHTIFPISPRNSPEAITQLMSETHAKCLFVGCEPAFKALAQAGLKGLGHGVQVEQMPGFGDLYPLVNIGGGNRLDSGGKLDDFAWFPEVQYDLDAPGLILHSSGSTRFPKPIIWSHRGLLMLARIPSFGQVDLASVIMGCHSMPMFHAMGVLQLTIAATTGITMSVFAPASPATFPTPTNVFEGTMITRSQLVCCAPTFIEAWSRNDQYVQYMRTMKAIMYGGGPLNKQVGDFLVSQGITIIPTYGCTEAGIVSTFLPNNPGMDWEYFLPSPHLLPEFRPMGDGTFEVVLLQHTHHTPRIINTSVKDIPAYATNDLVAPHPTKPGLWKIFGRADDQIMLSTGEKTNPGPLETILCLDPHVQSAVMFGRGRFQNGIIIDPKKEFAFASNDEFELVKFRNLIWPTVERMNTFAPQHSRIFKEMILVASSSKPFTYTAKGTARRQAVLTSYDAEIDALYTTVAQSTQSHIPAPTIWTYETTLSFVRETVESVMKKSVSPNVDLFQYGCDSLQATWIRNSILRGLRQTSPGTAQRLPSTLVYEHPSVESLAKVISASVGTDTNTKLDRIKEKIKEVDSMIAKYSTGLSTHVKSRTSDPVEGDVILLTGTTGGLGCELLHRFLSAEENVVSKVYVINRPGIDGDTLGKRQKDALAIRGLSPDLISHPKAVFLVGDLSKPYLGLVPEVFEEIRHTVTHIIHNAWRVDFNLSLKSFESNIAGLRNLVDLALASPHPQPPRLVFVSSIGVFRNPTFSGPALETSIVDPSVAVGTGYSESKYVGERILEIAHEQTPLRPITIRMGQLTGGCNGYWNEREWFPALVKSANLVGCLPDVEGTISWIQIQHAAAALAEMRNSDHPTLHIVHSRPVTWSSILQPIANRLNVPLVSYRQWLSKLETYHVGNSTLDEERARYNPALKLVEFFKSIRVHDNTEPMGTVRLDISKAVTESTTLKEKVAILGKADAAAWVDAWQRSGFLATPLPSDKV
ncbi:hypothetical protein JAAARDRAFT_294258 [Jaapia argillacea MUCL 33604]|uniref:Polyketide synthase-like phosphopantetheine-binding domain-containing protein n=1 Tax=Jaapia argillacea MUCL 33604 TaxID=933084 RepID=A0A067PRR1_9AGAM|nr:hypothetical protein JAAARDRAFT_294258 [Jaapia argillacea MUCL 33604]